MIDPMGHPDSEWFYWREVQPNLWLIAEPGHVYTWLVVGSERACLFDTGTGIAPIRPVVESITSLPIVVVNSHYHFDHVGGNNEFERVTIHPRGESTVRRPTPDLVMAGYLAFIRNRGRTIDQFRELDTNYFGLLTPETDPRPLPDGLESRIFGATPFTGAVDFVEDGDVIDLGGRELRVLHTPGHSPDALCLFDERDGLLLTGDTFNVGLVYCHFHDSDLETLKSTAQRLADMSSEVRYITAHHYPRVIAEPSLLVDYCRALEKIEDVSLAATNDAFGQPCLYAALGQFTITLPDPERPSLV